MSTLPKKESRLLPYLFLLTLLFIFLEVSYFIQCSDVYLSDYKMAAYKLAVPLKVIPEVVFFFIFQLSLHVIFTLIVWMLARLSSAAAHLSWKNTENVGYFMWFLGVMTLLLSNQMVYPNSKFAALIDFVLNRHVSALLLVLCLGLMLVAVLLSVWELARIISFRAKIAIAVISFILVGTISYHSLKPLQGAHDASTANQPNIILIGIDALRPDFVGFFGYAKQTPHIDAFLNNATVFANSLTPIARTFPSWTSILTGQYPKHNLVRTNLALQDQLDFSRTLPSLLHQKGYRTIYATDETRWSNIKPHLGFDRVMTPPLGFNDFFLGTLNDFPMSNLLVNTWLGKYFLPRSYANRPAFVTYDPDSFIEFVKPEIERNRDKPLFLAIHFCLAHLPYLWGREVPGGNVFQNYQAAVHRVDQQFADFIALLQQNHLLENTLIVLLSDHGEALELAGDRATDPTLFIPGKENARRIIPHFYPSNISNEKIDRSAGHGTDVLGLSQYRTMLAFRWYGRENHPATVPGRVSLLDIKPTVLDVLHQKLLKEDDGISLKNVLEGKQNKVMVTTDFFTESDFSPQAIYSTHPETRKLLFEGIDFFEIDPQTALLTTRPSMEGMIYASKQRAVFHDRWVLALYPQNKKIMMPILVDLYSGEWTNDLHTDFAKRAGAGRMLQSLKSFYGNEITSVKNS